MFMGSNVKKTDRYIFNNKYNMYSFWYINVVLPQYNSTLNSIKFHIVDSTVVMILKNEDQNYIWYNLYLSTPFKPLVISRLSPVIFILQPNPLLSPHSLECKYLQLLKIHSAWINWIFFLQFVFLWVVTLSSCNLKLRWRIVKIVLHINGNSLQIPEWY